MVTLIVDIRIRPEAVETWKRATLVNVAESRKEAGVLLFELMEDRDVSGHFMLIEKYRSDEDMAAHKETPHYLDWKKKAEPLEASPRTRAFFRQLEPAKAP